MVRSLNTPLIMVICILLFSCGKKGDPTLTSYQRPDPPSELRAIHRESEIILLWEFPKSKEHTIKGFHLKKLISPYPLAREGRGDFKKVAFIDKDKRSCKDEDITIGPEYKYKIVAQSLRGVTSFDSNIIEVSPQYPPAPPKKPSFIIEYDSLLITWENVEDNILYNVYKSKKRGFYPLHPINRESLKETSFRDSFDLKTSTYYTIRSLRGGYIRDEGPASEELEINPLDFVPSPPEGLHAVATEERVYLTWKDAPETWVTGYRVYREMVGKEGYILIGDTQIPTFVDRENPSLKRNYRVTAVGPSTEGPSSEIRDVVFVPYK